MLVVEVGESAGALEERYPRLPFVWLELTRGEDGVFLIEADEWWRKVSRTDIGKELMDDPELDALRCG